MESWDDVQGMMATRVLDYSACVWSTQKVRGDNLFLPVQTKQTISKILQFLLLGCPQDEQLQPTCNLCLWACSVLQELLESKAEKEKFTGCVLQGQRCCNFHESCWLTLSTPSLGAEQLSPWRKENPHLFETIFQCLKLLWVSLWASWMYEVGVDGYASVWILLLLYWSCVSLAGIIGFGQPLSPQNLVSFYQNHGFGPFVPNRKLIISTIKWNCL